MQATVSDKHYLTKRQLAERLQCCTRTIERRCAAGEIPRPLRIGRLVRWSAEQLEQWQEQEQT